MVHKLTGKKIPRKAGSATNSGLGLIEGGLSDRQKQFAQKMCAEIFARVLQHESPEPTNISSFEDIFNLTQMKTFIEWQEETLRSATGASNPTKRIMATIIQINCADMTARAVVGYMWEMIRNLDQALAYVKGVGNAVMRELHLESGIKTYYAKDNDGVEWQMYTGKDAPDSVLFRRVRSDSKKRKPKSNK